jgi:hypothetical protein
MPRNDVKIHLAKIDNLIAEINVMVPPSLGYSSVKFRADLAGMLVVVMTATYENCVKEILSDFAYRKNKEFGEFARKIFNKINAKIKVSDLYKYCGLFDVSIQKRFKDELKIKKDYFLKRAGINIEMSYDQIISWRHDFAHAWACNVTIEDAAQAHRIGKRIIYIFDSAFSSN